MTDPNEEFGRELRRRHRPDDTRHWSSADWDAHVEGLRAQADAIAEEADARPVGGFDAGARESAPAPGPSMDQLMRRAIGRRRYGDPGRFDADYFPPDAA